MSKRSSEVKNKFPHACIVEIAWEVCNQVGGIYTVIRSKAPEMVKNHGENFCMVGPFMGKSIQAEIEVIENADDPFAKAAMNLRKKGYDVIYAEWLITGKPKVVLLN